MTHFTVAIGVPSGDIVQTDFAMSLAMLCLNPQQGVEIALLNARSSLIAVGRNQCVGGAQAVKATHLLFLDSDMVFPPQTLTRLLSHDKDIVGATYSKRAPPFHPLTVTEEGLHTNVTSGLHRVQLLPTGCMLVRMKIFESLTKPYFNMAVEGDQLRGEDYYFCEKARAAGIEIWCDGDLSVELGHIGQKIHRLNDITDQT